MWFSMIPSVQFHLWLLPDDDPPPFWSAIDFSTDLHRDVVSRIHLDKDSPIRYDFEYMTSTELEERARLDTRDARIKSTYDPPLPDSNASTLATDVDFPSPSPTIPLPPAVPTPAPPSAFRPTTRFAGPNSPSGPRRSSRSIKGTWSSTRLSEEQAQERLPTDYVDKVFLSSVLDLCYLIRIRC